MKLNHQQILSSHRDSNLRNQIKVVLAFARRSVLKETGADNAVGNRALFIISAARASSAIEDELAWFLVTHDGFPAAAETAGGVPDDFVEQVVMSVINEPVFVIGMLRIVGQRTVEDMEKAAAAVQV